LFRTYEYARCFQKLTDAGRREKCIEHLVAVCFDKVVDKEAVEIKISVVNSANAGKLMKCDLADLHRIVHSFEGVQLIDKVLGSAENKYQIKAVAPLIWKTFEVQIENIRLECRANVI